MLCLLRHNAVMTITYSNGTVLQATLLFHDDYAIRAIVEGRDDALYFTRTSGAWMSEELEPVTLEFEWQRRSAAPVYSEDDCICPEDLASKLVAMLLEGAAREEAAEDKLFVFNPEGARIPIRRTDLLIH